MSGLLYIVASPIGSLQDITARALEVLRSVDLIACEDTRHSATLLQHYQINTPLKAYHSHNEAHCAQELLKKLQNGESIALLSDAGTPLLHDPGLVLVQSARAKGVRVVPIPGPCALITALSAAGLPAAEFVFAGFLPIKTVARQKQLALFSHETRTVIFYEAPHRILESVTDMASVFGEQREVVLARELTKIHETFLSGTLAQVLAQLQADPYQQKGEFVVLLAGVKEELQNTHELELEKVLGILLAELPLKQAVDLAARITGVAKNKVYALGLEKKAKE